MAKWDERAERWSRLQAQRSEIYRSATEMMLDLADLRTGNRVLDVAAGTGDQTLLAARRVGPTGYVLATDLSTNMLKGATDAVRKAGLTNVETRVMDAEKLDLDANSFDAVISRFSLYGFPKAVGGMRRVVKPGGKVAALVFSAVKKTLTREFLARSLTDGEEECHPCSHSEKPVCLRTLSETVASRESQCMRSLRIVVFRPAQKSSKD